MSSVGVRRSGGGLRHRAASAGGKRGAWESVNRQSRGSAGSSQGMGGREARAARGARQGSQGPARPLLRRPWRCRLCRGRVTGWSQQDVAIRGNSPLATAAMLRKGKGFCNRTGVGKRSGGSNGVPGGRGRRRRSPQPLPRERRRGQGVYTGMAKGFESGGRGRRNPAAPDRRRPSIRGARPKMRAASVEQAAVMPSRRPFPLRPRRPSDLHPTRKPMHGHGAPCTPAISGRARASCA